MIAWFVRNGVAANILMGLILVGGIASMRGIKMELFPDFDLDIITVSVPYPGAAPVEVEEAICAPIEEKIWDLAGVKELKSYARENVGVVAVEIESGFEVSRLVDEIKARVDTLETLPEQAEKPMVEPLVAKRLVLALAIHGQTDEKTLRKLAERTRSELTDLPNITQVTISGVRNPEISIEIPEKKLREHGLSFDDVARVLRASSTDMAGGVVKSSAGETLLRVKGKAYSGTDFENIELLSTPQGGKVYLGDVAEVIDGFEDNTLYTRFKGEPAITLRVFRVGKQSPLDISEQVAAYVSEKKNSLPDGLSMAIWQDRSYYLKGRLQMMVENATLGLLLVFLVLSLFLRPSLAFWVGLGIPISFCGAFAMMGVMGTSVNLVSLFAFIVVLGILVDDAIIVGESVYTKGKEGLSSRKAAIEGTRMVAVPVTFAVITSMVAFIPMLFLPGWAGKLTRDIPLVVIPALLFSLIESKFILPYHLSLCRFSKDKVKSFVLRIQDKIANSLERFVKKAYQPALEACLNRRYLTLSAFMGILIVTVGLIWGGHLPSIRGFPPVPSDYISVKLVMQEGTPGEETERILIKIERARREMVAELLAEGSKDPFKHVMTTMGGNPFAGGPRSGGQTPSGANLGEITGELVKSEERSKSAPEISALWRKKIGPLPGVKELNFQDVAAGGSRVAIDLEIAGRDLKEMAEAAKEVKSELLGYEGLFGITDTFAGGKKELELKLKENSRSLGISQFDLGRQVRQAFYGEEIQRLLRDSDEVKVMLRYPERQRKTLGALEEMRIRTADRAEIPFYEVAQASPEKGYPTIHRSNRMRTVNVQSSADKFVAKIPEIEEKLDSELLPELKTKYPALRFTFVGEKRESDESDSSLLQAFMITLFAIYGLLAIPFRSYLQPFLVMTVIPFGLVGAALGHLLFEIPLSRLSIFGLVALTGVVINDSLVLVHYINRERGKLEILHAARKAGSARFRPIILTSLTTFVGLLPILFERSLQAQFLKPMAISIGFGVLFATLITLILVPSLYLVLEDLRIWVWRLLGHLGWRKEEEISTLNKTTQG
ncbi:MAG: hypothetical protein CMI31_01545 [Opitutae bacterium]|nr:hypothetical protein [Opitutae bacterium]|tara:strand:- start:1021 stop:4200 length:3180 start_codon:yes stop_codon:yes gene_type:complete